MLIKLLEIERFDALLIFARTKNATMEIAEGLQGRGYAAEPLNGDMPQNLREKTVDRLKRGKINVLVATDVAARGSAWTASPMFSITTPLSTWNPTPTASVERDEPDEREMPSFSSPTRK